MTKKINFTDGRIKYANPEEQRLALNKRRQERYAKSKSYRDEVKTKSRERLRVVRQYDPANEHHAVTDDASLARIGNKRMLSNGELSLCFSMHELAIALGDYGVQALKRWVRVGMFPKPLVTAKDRIITQAGGRNVTIDVYRMWEVKGMCRAIAETQKIVSYFSKNDKSTIARVVRYIAEEKKIQKPTVRAR